MADAQIEVEKKSYLVVKETVDIRQLPKPEEIVPALGSITIGDLHGNALKLLHSLFMHGIIRFKKRIPDPIARYQKLAEVYEKIDTLLPEGDADKPTQAQLVEQCQEFIHALDAIEVCSPKTLVRLIGDELADRGSCDYLTLKILMFLRNQGVLTRILASNHGVDFIAFYEDLDTHGTIGSMGLYLLDAQKPSLWALRNLLQAEGGCSLEELRSLVEVAYKPHLMLLDYELGATGIRLFTHAPVRFSVVQHLARKLEVDYQDHTVQALANTIDAINAAFQDHCMRGELTTLFSAAGIPDTFTEYQQDQNPCICLIWNRWPEDTKDRYEATNRPSEHENYTIAYVHGHDMYDSPPEHVVILDSTLGKGLDYSDQGNYLAWNSSDCPHRVTKSFPYRTLMPILSSVLLFTTGLILGFMLVYTGVFIPFALTSVLLDALIFGSILGVAGMIIGVAGSILGLSYNKGIENRVFEPAPVALRISSGIESHQAPNSTNHTTASYAPLFPKPPVDLDTSTDIKDKPPNEESSSDDETEEEIVIEFTPGNNPFYL